MDKIRQLLEIFFENKARVIQHKNNACSTYACS